MIESWRRVLKHQWLFLNSLDTAATVRKLAAFYVEQYDDRDGNSRRKMQNVVADR